VDLDARSRAECCTVVIFGATGDLTHRKLIPALYNLAAEGELPADTRVIGFARREKSNEQFRDELLASARKVSRNPVEDELWEAFAQSISYHQSAFDDAEGYRALAELLQQQEHGSKRGVLYYLASSPENFQPIIEHLQQAGLNAPQGYAWARVIVEKPFGKDKKSATHLNSVLQQAFPEQSIYRIDHYLGKETAQNIMVLRFANAIFEPLWNSRYIDHVQITCSEHLGMEGGRGGYYDTAGALRDMVQNHLLQLLSLVAMEPPTDLSADGVRDEKVKVLRSMRRYNSVQDIRDNVIRAQYTPGFIDGDAVLGYTQEDRVNPKSQTESYVALRIHLDTWRWSGVPFYIRVGKRLPKKSTEISIHFKTPPSVLFNKNCGNCGGNVLVIRIQPDEGNSLRIISKLPGASLRLEPVKMNFSYSTSFGKGSPEAYERLLLDAMAGDATLFARADEVETAWDFIDTIEEAWHNSGYHPPMHQYVAGSWGPAEAEELLRGDGRSWRRL